LGGDQPGPLAELRVRELLDAVAAQTPAPGGGSTAACACALAAGLTEMAAAFTLARADYEDRHDRARAIHSRARALRARSLELAELELHAFAPVLEALRLPRDLPDRARRVWEAKLHAAESPLAVARVAAELADLCAELARDGNQHLVGDAITGCLLAEAACRSSEQLVTVNLDGAQDDPRVAEASALAGRAAAARRAAVG
jgi:formiminotetrahydrofolate cyclodeaminase